VCVCVCVYVYVRVCVCVSFFFPSSVFFSFFFSSSTFLPFRPRQQTVPPAPENVTKSAFRTNWSTWSLSVMSSLRASLHQKTMIPSAIGRNNCAGDERVRSFVSLGLTLSLECWEFAAWLAPEISIYSFNKFISSKLALFCWFVLGSDQLVIRVAVVWNLDELGSKSLQKLGFLKHSGILFAHFPYISILLKNWQKSTTMGPCLCRKRQTNGSVDMEKYGPY